MSFLWRLIPAVRPRERTRFLFFLSLDLLLSLSQTLGLVATESLILGHFGPDVLPYNFVAASLITVMGSLVYALGVNRAKNDLYFIRLHLIFAAMVFSLWSIGPQHHWAYLALGCVFYLSYAVLNNHYWTFTGDFFDTLSSKRLFPIFIIGNSLGGFLGGALISSGCFSTEALLPTWGVLLLLTALLLRVFRRSLRRWGPLELEEADETSLEGIRNSFLYLRQSSLGRWMVASCFALVISLFISQYLYSQIFAKAFSNDPEKLTHFFGNLLAVTNLLEIVIEGWITPFLMRNLGVATANLLHPLTTFMGYILLCFRFQVGSAILVRINRETLDNAMGQPVRNLVYNALPDRFRGRLRAFLEGIVVYTGMAVAGLLLSLSVGNISNQALTYCGLAASIVYLWANSRVRAAYLTTLVQELQAGRLELSELGNELATFEVHRLGQLWEVLIREGGDHPNPVAVRFANTLAARRVYEPLLRTAQSGSHTWLRCACIQALGKEAWRHPAILDLSALSPEPELRLAALEVLILEPAHTPAWLDQLTADPDPRVRALALFQFLQALQQEDPRRRAYLASLLAQARGPAAGGLEPAGSLPALLLLPEDACECLKERCVDHHPEVRAACLRRLGQFSGEQHLALFWQGLSDPEVSVKVACLAALSGSPGRAPLVSTEREIDHVARLLWNPSAEVRTAAAQLLAGLGDPALPMLIPALSSEDSRAVVASLDAFAQFSNPKAREQMAQQLRQRTEQLWYLNLAALIADQARTSGPNSQQASLDFLLHSLRDAARLALKVAFEILSRLEDPKVMRSVEKVLRFANVRARSDALEVLSNLGDREAAHLLVLLLEDAHWAERVSSLPPSLPKPGSLEEVVEWCLGRHDGWLRMAAQRLARGDETARAGAEWKEKEKLMERLLVLRKVPLFAQMTMDQLEAINQLLKAAQYLRGEVIFEQGDLGDELFILVRGEVRIMLAHGTSEEVELNRLAGVSYFGEMAILDDEPRSASVVCNEDSHLLVLKGDQLKELIHQMPEISFEIFKVLTARIRTHSVRVGNPALRSGELKTG